MFDFRVYSLESFALGHWVLTSKVSFGKISIFPISSLQFFQISGFQNIVRGPLGGPWDQGVCQVKTTFILIKIYMYFEVVILQQIECRSR